MLLRAKGVLYQLITTETQTATNNNIHLQDTGVRIPLTWSVSHHPLSSINGLQAWRPAHFQTARTV